MDPPAHGQQDQVSRPRPRELSRVIDLWWQPIETCNKTERISFDNGSLVTPSAPRFAVVREYGRGCLAPFQISHQPTPRLPFVPSTQVEREEAPLAPHEARALSSSAFFCALRWRERVFSSCKPLLIGDRLAQCVGTSRAVMRCRVHVLSRWARDIMPSPPGLCLWVRCSRGLQPQPLQED